MTSRTHVISLRLAGSWRMFPMLFKKKEMGVYIYTVYIYTHVAM